METTREERPLQSSRQGLLAKSASNREMHLYHPTKPPVITYTAQDEAAKRAEGYSEEYQAQEYPKVDHKSAEDRDSEKALFDQGYRPSEHGQAFPKVMSKTFNSADDAQAPKESDDENSQTAAVQKAARRRSE